MAARTPPQPPHTSPPGRHLSRRVGLWLYGQLPPPLRTRLPWLAVALLGLLALVLPTGQPTLDAWYYAANVRWADTDLFFPHHLLHSLPTWGLYRAAQTLGLEPDVLALATAVQALWSAVLAAALAQCLALMGWRPTAIAAGVLLAGLAFAPLRYATDNEAYLAPIALALLGTAQWLRAECGRPPTRAVWLSGLWLALAGAFHQLMVFWWVALAYGWFAHGAGRGMGQRLGQVVRFAAPSLVLLPGLYLWVLTGWLGQAATVEGVIYLLFREYFTGTAPTEFGVHNVLLSAVNLVRVFVQVHGYMAQLLRLNPLLWAAPAALAALTAAWALRRGTGPVRIWWRPAHRHWLRVLALAAGLHLAYAVYNIGNLEFMVMLPALAILMLAAATPTPRLRPLLGLALALGIWNTGYGLLPPRLYVLTSAQPLAARVAQEPQAVYILKDKLLISNILYYQTGQQPTGLYGWKPGLADSLTRVVSRAQAQGQAVYTDYVGNAGVVSRAELLVDPQHQAFFKQYTWQLADSLPTALGPHRLYRLKP